MTEQDFICDVQDAITAWHAKRYPLATDVDVALKLAEEAGEVAKAVGRLQEIARGERAGEPAAWTRNLEEEVGDVGIVLAALCGRRGWRLDDVIANRAAEVMGRR